MPNTNDVITLEVNYSVAVTDEKPKLSTQINYPQNFLLMPEREQVAVLDALIDVLNNLPVPEAPPGEHYSVEAAHDDLVENCSSIFPFGSSIILDMSNKEEAIGCEFRHDPSIGSMHPYHSVVLIDSIIQVLTAMCVMIIKKSEKDSA